MEKIGSQFKRFGDRITTALTIVIIALLLCGATKRDGVSESSEEIHKSILFVNQLTNSTYGEPFWTVTDSLTSIPFWEHYLDSVANSNRIRLYMDSVADIKNNLICSVDDYINKVAPKSRMSAENIVNQCLENDFDITLLMAQAHQETHFASCGSNNCFGIKNGKMYKHPDETVSDYITLIQRDYMCENTVEQLLASNMRRAKGGHYSTLSTYGSTISNLRNKIIRNTDIMDLFMKIKEMNEIIESEV